MMRELARQRVFGGAHGLVLRSQALRVQAGQSNRIFLSVRDPELVSQMPASIPIVMTSANGRQTITLAAVSAGHRQYEGEVTPWVVGHYTLAAKRGVLPAVVKPVEMDVAASMREFITRTSDPAALSRMVVGTGGAVVPLAGQQALAQQQQAVLDLVGGLGTAALLSLYTQSPWGSAQAASAARAQAIALIDVRIDAAANSGNEALYQAWTALLALAVADLSAEIQQLPSLGPYTTGASLSALALANRLYPGLGQQDVYAAQLASLNDVENPLFMPAAGQMLAA
jgi:hypothetical protein